MLASADAGVENLKKYVQNGGKLIWFRSIVRDGPRNVRPSNERGTGGDEANSTVRLDASSLRLIPNSYSPRGSRRIHLRTSPAVPHSTSPRMRTPGSSPVMASLGWTLGEKYRDGKAALVGYIPYGKGKIVLFGFRPQHRGQTWGTFPFIFNALEK